MYLNFNSKTFVIDGFIVCDYAMLKNICGLAMYFGGCRAFVAEIWGCLKGYNWLD